MQTEARVGVVVEGGQRALNSAHGGVAVNGTARKLAQQQKSLHQQSQIGTVPQLLAGGIAGALSKTCTAPLARLTILLQRYYLAAGKELMRINGTTKSFVVSYLAESIVGAMTIRAFGEEDRHFSKNLGFIDMHASPFFYSFTANEWLILRLEILCAIVLSSSALALTLLNTSASKSGLIGMALSYGLSLNVYLVFSIQNQCHLANMIVSVERLEQYMNIPSEAPEVIESNQPPLSWPAIGEVEICDLKVRYQPNAPFVLQGISCKFRGGEKIGIVGRTGSGKTTLIST